MKRIDFGQTIQVIANLGVIAGIIFLAIEMRQNSQVLRAQAISTVVENRLNRQDRVIENEGVAALYAKNDRKEPLTDEELMRMQATRSRGFISWQRDYFLFQEGILTEEYFRANFPIMKASILGTSGSYTAAEHWERWRESSAAPSFRVFVEQCIEHDCDVIPR